MQKTELRSRVQSQEPESPAMQLLQALGLALVAGIVWYLVWRFGLKDVALFGVMLIPKAWVWMAEEGLSGIVMLGLILFVGLLLLALNSLILMAMFFAPFYAGSFIYRSIFETKCVVTCPHCAKFSKKIFPDGMPLVCRKCFNFIPVPDPSGWTGSYVKYKCSICELETFVPNVNDSVNCPACEGKLVCSFCRGNSFGENLVCTECGSPWVPQAKSVIPAERSVTENAGQLSCYSPDLLGRVAWYRLRCLADGNEASERRELMKKESDEGVGEYIRFLYVEGLCLHFDDILVLLEDCAVNDPKSTILSVVDKTLIDACIVQICEFMFEYLCELPGEGILLPRTDDAFEKTKNEKRMKFLAECGWLRRARSLSLSSDLAGWVGVEVGPVIVQTEYFQHHGPGSAPVAHGIALNRKFFDRLRKRQPVRSKVREVDDVVPETAEPDLVVQLIDSNKLVRIWRLLVTKEECTVRFQFTYGWSKSAATVWIDDTEHAQSDAENTPFSIEFTLSSRESKHDCRITFASLSGFFSPSLEKVMMEIDGNVVYSE